MSFFNFDICKYNHISLVKQKRLTKEVKRHKKQCAIGENIWFLSPIAYFFMRLFNMYIAGFYRTNDTGLHQEYIFGNLNGF